MKTFIFPFLTCCFLAFNALASKGVEIRHKTQFCAAEVYFKYPDRNPPQEEIDKSNRERTTVTLREYITLTATLDGKKLAGSVELIKVSGVSRSAFDMEAQTVTTPNMVLPISDDVQCYNKTTKTWFGGEDTDPMDALNLARAFSETLTVYYDKAPEDGGKVRVVVAE